MTARRGKVSWKCLQVKEESLFGILVLVIASVLLVIVAMLSHVIGHQEGLLAGPDSLAKSLYLRHHHGNDSKRLWNDVKDSFVGGDIDMGLVISGGGGSKSMLRHTFSNSGGIFGGGGNHRREEKARRKRVAYAITITKDGFFQDGAAVLSAVFQWLCTLQTADVLRGRELQLESLTSPRLRLPP